MLTYHCITYFTSLLHLLLRTVVRRSGSTCVLPEERNVAVHYMALDFNGSLFTRCVIDIFHARENDSHIYGYLLYL